ncbi:hypothetical protein T03_8556 [Trichinella britovi]|uniref:Uncharacterized protein n=2 Tax=Trichinella TaxID=6333 RepID=A0A0V1CYU3_TRIBR|nr:hypothetical protein T05_5734 [Trichinella murrelli]KRX59869.1 hypothetical protein T09_408 [Trichinella sp. T9]KRY54421.1 hypothetical protein T03_8556 [Trichinella britovi]KRZ93681.1 hypothetical protein T08_3530 [Trichinella sp. T8]
MIDDDDDDMTMDLNVLVHHWSVKWMEDIPKNEISIRYFIGLPERTSELIPGFGLLAWPAVVNESNDRSQITLVRHLRCITSQDRWNKSGGIVFDVNDQAMIRLRFLTINFGQVD